MSTYNYYTTTLPPPPSTSQNREFYLLSKKLRKLLPFNLGLKNHGNTCFMNCVLQSLFHTPPLCEYFITSQHEKEMKNISIQNSSLLLSEKIPPFALTRSFYRLLLSMWRNEYDTAYSYQIKNLIGELNPTFAGVNQNDSHEFCVWFLDRLSQELSLKTTYKETPNDKKSFIEDLFKVEFKSTVICSKCKYKSTKNETDMMLSLPLPQNHIIHSKVFSNSSVPKTFVRKSLYASLVLTKKSTINNLLSTAQLSPAAPVNNIYSYDSTDLKSSSSSKYYTLQTSKSFGNGLSNEIMSANSSAVAPLILSIAFNVHLTSLEDDYSGKELVYLSENSTNKTVVNPSFEDLRSYLSNNYQISESSLVFLDVNQTENDFYDRDSVKEKLFTYYKHQQNSNMSSLLYIVELSDLPPPQQTQTTPFVNLIVCNVYYEYTQQKRFMINYGAPFVVLINRDCTYVELVKKLLDSQVKYFQDKNILKYTDTLEKLFTLSLIDTQKKETRRLSPTDELPLYAQFVDHALNESTKMSNSNNADAHKIREHIKLNIEWKSYEDITQ